MIVLKRQQNGERNREISLVNTKTAYILIKGSLYLCSPITVLHLDRIINDLKLTNNKEAPRTRTSNDCWSYAGRMQSGYPPLSLPNSTMPH